MSVSATTLCAGAAGTLLLSSPFHAALFLYRFRFLFHKCSLNIGRSEGTAIFLAERRIKLLDRDAEQNCQFPKRLYIINEERKITFNSMNADLSHVTLAAGIALSRCAWLNSTSA